MARRRLKKGEVQKKYRSLISHFHSKSPISEQYRTIRSNIHFASLGKDVRVITVTSATTCEGKSTTATNLATVLSQQHHKVLLIDADMRKPSCHFSFGVFNNEGLTNVLIKNETLPHVITETFVPNLYLLTSGPIPPNPAELLGMKSMEWLLNLLRREYDYIIIDTPPVLSVTDAQIIAEKSDGIILVSSSGLTTKENIVKAKDLLAHTRTKLLGVVLNRVRTKNKEAYYGVNV